MAEQNHSPKSLEECCAPAQLLHLRVGQMELKVGKLEDKVYSPQVMVAVIGAVATFSTVSGSILVALIQLYAKAQGWV